MNVICFSIKEYFCSNLIMPESYLNQFIHKYSVFQIWNCWKLKKVWNTVQKPKSTFYCCWLPRCLNLLATCLKASMSMGSSKNSWAFWGLTLISVTSNLCLPPVDPKPCLWGSKLSKLKLEGLGSSLKFEGGGLRGTGLWRGKLEISSDTDDVTEGLWRVDGGLRDWNLDPKVAGSAGSSGLSGKLSGTAGTAAKLLIGEACCWGAKFWGSGAKLWGSGANLWGSGANLCGSGSNLWGSGAKFCCCRDGKLLCGCWEKLCLSGSWDLGGGCLKEPEFRTVSLEPPSEPGPNGFESRNCCKEFEILFTLWSSDLLTFSNGYISNNTF